MPGPTIEVLSEDIKGLKADIRQIAELIEAEHKQRMEYARIEHERRMEVIEAEAALVDARYRRRALQITPSYARLKAGIDRRLSGEGPQVEGNFDDEEMPY